MSFARVPICTGAMQFQEEQPSAGLCVPLLSAPSLTPAQPSPGHKEVQGLNWILFSFGPDWIWVSSITKLMQISTCHLSTKGSKTVSPKGACFSGIHTHTPCCSYMLWESPLYNRECLWKNQPLSIHLYSGVYMACSCVPAYFQGDVRGLPANSVGWTGIWKSKYVLLTC